MISVILSPVFLFIITVLQILMPRTFAQISPYLIPESGELDDPQFYWQTSQCSFITGNFHFHCIPLYVAYLIQLIFSFLGTICLLMIIWSGFEFAISGFQGDTSKAKSRLQNAIFGLAFAVLSFLMVDLIVSALLL